MSFSPKDPSGVAPSVLGFAVTFLIVLAIGLGSSTDSLHTINAAMGPGQRVPPIILRNDVLFHVILGGTVGVKAAEQLGLASSIIGADLPLKNSDDMRSPTQTTKPNSETT